MKELGYYVYYFDEQMKGALKENVEVHDVSEIYEDASEEYKMKRIITLLNVAYKIAHYISDKNVNGWINIYYALEPIQEALNCDMKFISQEQKSISREFVE